MPVDQTVAPEIAGIEVTGFSWVPPFARGMVRDYRIRWALEELGLPYRTRLMDAREARPAAYFSEQPFGQVPAYVEGDIRMFESGAVCLYLAERGEVLLPRDEIGRTRAMSWCFAALNSIEPALSTLIDIDLFFAGEEWAKARRPGAIRAIRERLDQLTAALGDQDWLEGRFTVGDLLMASALRELHHSDLLPEYPALAAYVARAEARPAFKRAIAAQMADFIPDNDEQERIEA